jgi:hypothetical protein
LRASFLFVFLRSWVRTLSWVHGNKDHEWLGRVL